LEGIERELCHVSLLENTIRRKKWKEKLERELTHPIFYCYKTQQEGRDGKGN